MSERTQPRFRKRSLAGRAAIYIVLTLLGLFCLFPFYLMVINSTHTTAEISTQLNLLPGNALFDNYRRMSDTIPVWNGLKNSLIVALSSTLLCGYFSAMAAYGFSKFRFKGQSALFAVLLGSMMVPGQLGILGYFKLVLGLQMTNSLIPLIIPSIANASTVFFLKVYMDSYLNNSIIEAARMDGSGEVRTFNAIVLRIVIPAIATMSIFNFVGYWNNLMLPLVLLQTDDKFTLPLLISNLRGPYLRDWGATYMAVTVSVVPIIIVFAVFSKFILDGLTLGSTKE